MKTDGDMAEKLAQDEPLYRIEYENYIILIVDDNPINLAVVVNYLETYGFELIIARTGKSAIERAESVQPALILLDVMMPGIDGFETCRQLKANPFTKEIPVIFMTALTGIDDRVMGFKVGAVDYVTKPIQQAELLARIEMHLSLRDLHKNLQANNRQLQQEIQERERIAQSLHVANTEILALNQRLTNENVRLEAEIDIARQIQQMLLPAPSELEQISGLDIVGFMQPTDEVGGDYYDVLQYGGRVKIGIGDVTGHGLKSGLVMLMTQTAIRTLLASGQTNPRYFLTTLNRAMYENMQRMKNRRNLSLTLLDYVPQPDGEVATLTVSGQHELILVVRRDGQVDLVDTTDLGFPIGMVPQIDNWVTERSIELQVGDGLVLYTDGLTEATNREGYYYGLERLCALVSEHWAKSVDDIKDAIVFDVNQFIGTEKLADDLTFVVIKRK
jgi:serine phosphatase RsbU (regulator of sigma subunit)